MLDEVPAGLEGVVVPVILGPTGVGKSRTAFELALRLRGEIVVCDSRQVYRDLDIATNKPLPDQRRAVPHHLIDVAGPGRTYNAFEFVRAAGAAIAGIAARGRLPLVEGGSVLWADALTDGFSLAGVPPRPERRQELDGLATPELVELLQRLDPEAGVDLRNRVRLVRAIEVLEVAGPPLARLRARQAPPWRALRIGLRAPWEVIDARLRERSWRQLERGLIEETRAALEGGVPAGAPALTGIGYAETVAHLRGEIPLSELAAAMARGNRRYARRQLRWLGRDPRITWFEATADPVPAVLGFLRERLPALARGRPVPSVEH